MLMSVARAASRAQDADRAIGQLARVPLYAELQR